MKLALLILLLISCTPQNPSENIYYTNGTHVCRNMSHRHDAPMLSDCESLLGDKVDIIYNATNVRIIKSAEELF